MSQTSQTPARLTVGAAYPCPRCHAPHVVEQPYADRSTAERTHLYIACRGDRYFVGQVSQTSETSQTGTGGT